jgi:hypothetical protein
MIATMGCSSVCVAGLCSPKHEVGHHVLCGFDHVSAVGRDTRIGAYARARMRPVCLETIGHTQAASPTISSDAAFTDSTSWAAG